MITEKFNKDLAKGNKIISKIIEDLVAQYFGKEKITEESLRALKQDVSKAVDEYKKQSQACKIYSLFRKGALRKTQILNLQTVT
jgi:hypothetical protein